MRRAGRAAVRLRRCASWGDPPLTLDYHSPLWRNARLQEQIPDLAKYVEPDRVRREVYTDQTIFDLEMQRIHEKVWIYCGHETQVPKAGAVGVAHEKRRSLITSPGAGWWRNATCRARRSKPAAYLFASASVQE